MSDHDIKLSDLSGEFRDVADVIGIDAAIRLAKIYGGGMIYVPKVSSLGREARNRQICADFNGVNYRDLARAHGLTVSAIRDIVRPLNGAGDSKKNDGVGPVQKEIPFSFS